MKKFLLLSILIATIFTSCTKDDKKEVVIPILPVDTSTLKTFKDVTFTLDALEGFTATKYFSTELGKSYKKSQIDALILPKIDLAFSGSYSSLNYFFSPNDASNNGITNGTKTDFLNYVTTQYSVEKFNALEKGADLDALIVTNDNESFPDSKLPVLVLFKNATGKKGVIYVKSVTRVGGDPRITVDIKVQK
jgi:hypothetical protein